MDAEAPVVVFGEAAGVVGLPVAGVVGGWVGGVLAFAAEEGDRVFDRHVRLGGERHQKRLDGAEEAELAEDLRRGREGENRRVGGAQRGEALGHEAVAREREELRAREQASREQQRETFRALLVDVQEFLETVSEYADGAADVVDREPDETGADCQAPNEAMRWQIALDSNYNGPGLLERVGAAIAKAEGR